jgi:pimeloyl-[acyl-carrier protein] methyl ester esterase
MVAIAAALQQPERIERLSLVCTTPRFMQTDGWPHGSSETLMENLATQFERDYAKALSRFFLLQFGSAPDARTQSREIAKRVLAEPPAAWQSLEQGLNLLRTVDLRDQLGSLSIPTQVIVGKEDRVIPADAGRFLASNIPEAALVEANSGHIPFLVDPAWFVSQLREFSRLKSSW